MTRIFWSLVILLAAAVTTAVRADQIEMQNGDRYIGSVSSMTPDTVVLQSEILGQIKLPRSKVLTISLGSFGIAKPGAAATNNPVPSSLASTAHSGEDTANPLRELGANTNLVEKIRRQFLADAGPQANDKFNELLTGLITGKLGMEELRAEAKSAADQLRAMKRDMGGESGVTVDAYLGVLDNFLAQSAAPAPAVTPTNSPQGNIIIR